MGSHLGSRPPISGPAGGIRLRRCCVGRRCGRPTSSLHGRADKSADDGAHAMQTYRISKDRQQRFFKALTETGHPAAAVAAAGVDRTLIWELRASDPEFRKQWETAEKLFDETLGHLAHQRAVSGI